MIRGKAGTSSCEAHCCQVQNEAAGVAHGCRNSSEDCSSRGSGHSQTLGRKKWKTFAAK